MDGKLKNFFHISRSTIYILMCGKPTNASQADWNFALEAMAAMGSDEGHGVYSQVPSRLGTVTMLFKNILAYPSVAVEKWIASMGVVNSPDLQAWTFALGAAVAMANDEPIGDY